MKTTLCTFFFFVSICLISYAQTSKGNFLLGGSFGIINEIDDTDLNNVLFSKEKQTFFHVRPSLGYFIANNLVIGLNPNYSSQKTILTGEQNYRSQIFKTFSISPFVRYYKKLNEKVSVFGQANIFSFERMNSEIISRVANVEDKTTSNRTSLSPGFTFSPGLVFFATNKLGIEVSLGLIRYSFTRAKTKGTSIQGNISEPIENTNTNRYAAFSLDPSRFSLGLQFYFSR
ncbi:porin family protein [Rhodocytophaga rosea]|uniref:Porin family protein n=1 Tax=Rhodocytophaga rosea TaxID=2704465 RepID=A0A6C0GLQ6_9BACT|nr:porin family protein [Rhodocytophaga rosea]QHT68570.1 porin family protein [Rhodocytophaga rosea]